MSAPGGGPEGPPVRPPGPKRPPNPVPVCFFDELLVNHEEPLIDPNLFDCCCADCFDASVGAGDRAGGGGFGGGGGGKLSTAFSYIKKYLSITGIFIPETADSLKKTSLQNN